ncbi:uncharacterized protein LOC142325275 isoform X2 [Lycorma delicatula]|uniref:uncharacterized protein LOC142325275 isoform X2 n=1 Tax=Lycorma delicatula TaxID=130591 RepID=UPI003F50F39D
MKKTDKLENKDVQDIVYDYDKFKDEYYLYVASSPENSDILLRTTKPVIDEPVAKRNIIKQLFKLMNIEFNKRCPESIKYNINDITCIFTELKYIKTTEGNKILIKHIKKTIIFWFIIYLLIGIPLWIWQGLYQWMCCYKCGQSIL